MAETIKNYMNVNGFYKQQTGGGCTAYIRTGTIKGYEREAVRRIEALITEQSGCVIPKSFNTPVTLGYFDEEGLQEQTTEHSTIKDAVNAFNQYLIKEAPHG